MADSVTLKDGPQSETVVGPSVGRRLRLWLECLILFVGVPLAIATVISPRHVFAILFALTAVGIVLLALTPGFRWRSLVENAVPRPRWRLLGETALFVVVTGVVVTALTFAYRPNAFLWMPTRNPELWILILTLYPLLSALPQELLYRPLFFARYGALFPSTALAVAANAAAFGLAHAFLGNWIAVVLSAVGGACFAYVYAVRGSFFLAWLWHSLAGLIIFTAGLGRYFYHGAAPG